MIDSDVCFSPQALVFLGGAWVVIQGVIVYLFRGWMGSLKDHIAMGLAATAEARAERDRALDGWEATIGLGEKAVRRDRRRRP